MIKLFWLANLVRRTIGAQRGKAARGGPCQG